MNRMPQFEQAIKDRIVDPAARQNNTGGYAIILEYNRDNHTATVLVARPGSKTPGETIKNVQCPIYPGVQQVDPEPGRPCWVVFRDGVKTSPVIVSYYSPNYAEIDRRRQTVTKNYTPRFMMDM